MAEKPFCPFVGLRPFDEEDQRYFFGREREVRAIVDNLFGARVTVFYGASGVGKSSVLLAGVVPELRKEPRTAVVVFRSWQIPNADAQLRREIAESASYVAGRDLGLDETLPLDELLKRSGEAIDGTVLLILDQFEEFFLYFKDPDSGFDTELARAIGRRDVDAGFLISLREDALSKLDRFKKRVPGLLSNTRRLFHLRVSAAKLAIVKPIELYNEIRPEAAGRPVAIEPALVDAVLAQTAPGQLSIQATEARSAAEVEEGRVEAPYLQLVLERLWAEDIGGGGRVLRLATLERLGGAETIVRTHLDQVLDRLDARDQELCARVFDRLVTPSGAKIASKVRDLASYAGDLADEVQGLTKFFEQNRILARIPAPAGAPEEDDQYQIFHDVLAPGILAWRERFLHAKEKAAAEREAAERARAAAEEERSRELNAAREEQLRLAQERAEEERRHRKKFQYAMVALAFMTAWVAIFAYKFYLESEIAQAQAALAEKRGEDAKAAVEIANKTLAKFELEKSRDEYNRTKDLDGAISALTRIVEKLDPGNAPAYALRGRVHLDRALVLLVVDQGRRPMPRPAAEGSPAWREVDLAIADLNRSLELDLRQPNVLVTRAEARHAKGDLKGAIADYDAAVAVSPRDAQLLFNRAALRARAGDQPGAIDDYTAAIGINDRFADAYLARAELLESAKRRKEAIEDFRRAAQVADNSATRLAAQRRLADLGVSTAAVAASVRQSATTVVLHFTGEERTDRPLAERVRRALAQVFRTEDIQPVPGGRTTGDVRYFVGDEKEQTARDERAANDVAKLVEETLAMSGFKLGIRVIALDMKRFPDAKPGVIEAWLPPLSRDRAVPQLQQRAL